MITTEPIKKCIKCLETLPLSGFHSKGFRNGKKRYDPQCKKCRNKIALDIYQKNIINKFVLLLNLDILLLLVLGSR